MTHICVSKLTIIGPDNGLSPGRHQAIIWTNDGILLIGPLGTNFSEILMKIYLFSFKKMHLKISSANWRPFCLGLNELRVNKVRSWYWSRPWIGGKLQYFINQSTNFLTCTDLTDFSLSQSCSLSVWPIKAWESMLLWRLHGLGVDWGRCGPHRFRRVSDLLRYWKMKKTTYIILV